MPLQGFSAILSGADGRIEPERIRHLGIVGALATWRVTQGIYRFDPDLAAAAADTPLSGDLPVGIDDIRVAVELAPRVALLLDLCAENGWIGGDPAAGARGEELTRPSGYGQGTGDSPCGR